MSAANGHARRGWRPPLSAFVLATTLAAVIALGGCARGSGDIAAAATLSSSSESNADQSPAKAADGVVAGAPAEPTHEWVAAGGVDSWLQLQWAKPQTIDRVVLHDRPNLRDGIIASRLTFDSGPSVAVGALPNDGTGVTVVFPARTTAVLRFIIEGTSSGTKLTGLAEIEVWTPGSASLASRPARDPKADCSGGSVVNIVAHADDDLLFMSLRLQQALAAHACIRTVVLTAGDNGADAAYSQRRELGSRAAYAAMAQASDSWRSSELPLAGGSLELLTLAQDSRISLVFLRLPDGNLAGQGFPSSGYGSLEKLWNGQVPTLAALDGKLSFTKDELIAVVTEVVDEAVAGQVNTLDPRKTETDHSDHRYTALIADTAVAHTVGKPVVAHFMGYGTSARPANLTGEPLRVKLRAFFTYAMFDEQVCTSEEACAATPYGSWLVRQYKVTP